MRGLWVDQFYGIKFRDAIYALAQNDDEKEQWVSEVCQFDSADFILSLALPTMRNLKILEVEFPLTPKYVVRRK